VRASHPAKLVQPSRRQPVQYSRGQPRWPRCRATANSCRAGLPARGHGSCHVTRHCRFCHQCGAAAAAANPPAPPGSRPPSTRHPPSCPARHPFAVSQHRGNPHCDSPDAVSNGGFFPTFAAQSNPGPSAGRPRGGRRFQSTKKRLGLDVESTMYSMFTFRVRRV
jgi:hypothetical protein